jgi:hypothetical protein
MAMGAAVVCGVSAGLFGACGPFTDVAADSFCPFVLEIFDLGITAGTTATTYDPASPVSRLPMAAFLSRTVDRALLRGGRRAALGLFEAPRTTDSLGLVAVGAGPRLLRSDGADLWVANKADGTVSRVRASDGRLLETWTGASFAYGVVIAMGRVLVTGETSPGILYEIDPSRPAGAVTTVASNLGDLCFGAAFDGARVWTANNASVSIVTPSAAIPWIATTVTAGFSGPDGILFDGGNVWVADYLAGTMLRLDSSAAVLQTVTTGAGAHFPVFDGVNIWSPNLLANSVTVFRASSGSVLQTLTGNGLSFPASAAFDGTRVLVANEFGDSVSLWKAADLTPLGTFPTGAGTNPLGSCSDGVRFWVSLQIPGQLARF